MGDTEDNAQDEKVPEAAPKESTCKRIVGSMLCWMYYILFFFAQSLFI